MTSDFARVFSSLRKERGYSQKKVAKDMGISQALLSHYENGLREPRIDFLIKICNYYDVSADYLLGMTGVRSNFSTKLKKDHAEESERFFALAAAFMLAVENEKDLKTRLTEKAFVKRALFISLLDMGFIDFESTRETDFSKEKIRNLCRASMLSHEAMSAGGRESAQDVPDKIRDSVSRLTDETITEIGRETILFEREILEKEITND